MNKTGWRRILCLLPLMLLLCGCRASIIAGSEITVRGVVTDTSYATVEEKPYGIMEKAYPRILLETEKGEIYGFFKRNGTDPATCFPGDTVEIRGGTESGSGLTVATEITVLEKGERHLEWEAKQAETESP